MKVKVLHKFWSIVVHRLVTRGEIITIPDEEEWLLRAYLQEGLVEVIQPPDNKAITGPFLCKEN